MNNWCLMKNEADKFRKGLIDGSITPEKLESFNSSAERRAFLAKFVGDENAKQVNALFESKLLVNNKRLGLARAAEKILGNTPKAKKDIISRINRLSDKELLNPEFEKNFKEDMVSKSLGMTTSYEDSKVISDLSKKVEEAAKNYDINKAAKMGKREFLDSLKDKAFNEKRLNYGRAVVDLLSTVSDIKAKENKITFGEFKKNPVGTALKGMGAVADLSKSLTASYDDSAILNQGFPILANITTAPIWARSAVGTIKNMINSGRGMEVWKETLADLVSRPNYINGTYKDYSLAVNVSEESFPTSAPEKLATIGNKDKVTNTVLFPIHILGKGYKATEEAFNIFQLRNRFEVFDLFMAIAEKEGKNLSANAGELEGLGKFVNSLTARGRLGKLEPVGNVINAPFFSLRKQVAAVESLFFYQIGKQSSFVRKRGAVAMLQQILLIAGLLGLAKAINSTSVETDTTSSDFGKIRVGKTTFDLTGGRAAYIVLVSRILQNKMKSSMTGNTTDINTGEYKSLKASELIGDFAQNKLSPLANELIYIMNRENREGNRPTIGSALGDLYVPLNFSGIKDLLDSKDAANYITATLANFFGIQTNTYMRSNKVSHLIPTETVFNKDDLYSMAETYAKALHTDPETALNRILTGQKIVQVSQGGIIVVDRQSVVNSQDFKKKWVKEHGGRLGDIKEVRLDHVIPNKLGGEEAKDNWAVVPTSVWSANSKIENTLIQAVKDKKISLKEAQDLMRQYKRPSKDSKGYATENPDEKFGQQILDRFK